ncbi:MAG: hypothetical protein GTN62_13430 [Gemmatimonadales bacterium]|nr:hypothetical protein [Gemmatimonadales bacterium]NIN13012.1 hypothetical protein [Gemmatimonadales bacterium]NIN51089.1 hypothetical protein [Gemmatimonadales bacterium]NIP08553.1 hypothetical protein [Gemmatimonadales bacterium]NIR02271.1 hypothetical protein [Gemmatimonadales bacterium]
MKTATSLRTSTSFTDPLSIIEQIISDLHAADIVIADLSGQHLLQFRNELTWNDVAYR